jgi:hypothetical protein
MQQGRNRGIVAGAVVVVAGLAFTGGMLVGRSSASDDDAIASSSPAVTAPSTTPAVAAGTKPHVIIYGDSLVTQAEPYLTLVSPALGLDVEARALGGTAACDFLAPLNDDLQAERADLVVWAFSGNSIGSCMVDDDGNVLTGDAVWDRYRADTTTAIEAAAETGVPFVLASPPAPALPGDPWEQLDTVYREIAAEHPSVLYADAGVAISPVGEFIATQRCLPFELRIPVAREACGGANGEITVRGSDGHFCPQPSTTGLECPTYSSGAMRYAINLLQAARIELDYRAEIAAGYVPPA